MLGRAIYPPQPSRLGPNYMEVMMNKGVPAAPSGHSSKTEPCSTVSAQSVSVPNAAREAAEAEAAKRERHKPKTLAHKQWRAVFTQEKGWHVALTEDPRFAEGVSRLAARQALLRGDLEAFHKHCANALLARCASAIEAAAAGETTQIGSTEGESATRDSGGRPNDAQKGSANV